MVLHNIFATTMTKVLIFFKTHSKKLSLWFSDYRKSKKVVLLIYVRNQHTVYLYTRIKFESVAFLVQSVVLDII